jgi:hypothetical protein
VQQKIVLGVQMNCQKCRRKALEVVAETDGKCWSLQIKRLFFIIFSPFAFSGVQACVCIYLI